MKLKLGLPPNSLGIVLAVCLCGPAVAGAKLYNCSSKEYCQCEGERGCKPLDPLLNPELLPSCGASDRVFQTSVWARGVRLEEQGLYVEFREARPYFGDFDWYQSGQNSERGLLNYNFDNESQTTPFLLREMVRGSFNDFVWSLSGTCKAAS